LKTALRPKIAVNARGCNEAKLVVARHEMIAESPPELIPLCHIASCSRHSAICIRTPGVGRHRPMGIGGVKEDKLSMLQLSAFRRSLVALALCSTAFAVSAQPPHQQGPTIAQGGMRITSSSITQGGTTHFIITRHMAHRYRHMARTSSWDAGVARMRSRGLADAYANLSTSTLVGGESLSGGFGSSNVVADARRYLGGNPTGRGSLWCARFMNMVLQESGYRGTGSDLARSFASYGHRVSGPQSRRHRGDGTARRRTCRHHHRHRCPRQPDHDLRQQWQSRQGSADLARPHLRLRDADELSTIPSTLLRANGSRECAPDDRLREAIHVAAHWIASSLTLLAMTGREPGQSYNSLGSSVAIASPT